MHRIHIIDLNDGLHIKIAMPALKFLPGFVSILRRKNQIPNDPEKGAEAELNVNEKTCRIMIASKQKYLYYNTILYYTIHSTKTNQMPCNKGKEEQLMRRTTNDILHYQYTEPNSSVTEGYMKKRKPENKKEYKQKKRQAKKNKIGQDRVSNRYTLLTLFY